MGPLDVTQVVRIEMANLSLDPSWITLYTMLGGASATLLGFLFVAAQLHIDRLTSGNKQVFLDRSRNSLLHVVVTLVVAVAVLAPQWMALRCIEIVGAGAFGLKMSFQFYLDIIRSDTKSPLTARLILDALNVSIRELAGRRKQSTLVEKGRVGGYSIWRARFHVGGNLLICIGGGLLFWQRYLGMFLITVAYLAALVLGIWNAWKQATDTSVIQETGK
jgi:hypothetical protein